MAEEKEKNIDDFLDEFDADGVGDYEWEEEHGSNEEQSTTISTKDDESTAPQTSQEPSLTVTSSSVKKDDPRGRVYPLAKICPRGKLDLMRQPPASVTAIVCLKNDPTKFFILGCGHAFYDYDANRDKSAVGDPTPNTVEWEWTGYPDDGVERTHSISYGRYYRMGDKLGSQLDASLCQIHANVKWSNEYRSYNIQTQKQTPTKRLIGLDGRWPPAANAETVYQAHEVMLSYSDFIIRDRFVTTWKTWDSRANPNNVAVLQNVMLRVRPGETVNGTNLIKGASGSALIRHITAKGSQDAVVVGIFLGICGSREVDDKLDTKTTYEVYQHVSEALKKFDLNDELPQWELK